MTISSTGRCLCGGSRCAFDGPILWRAHCHCESCRRNTSAAVATFFAVPKSAARFSGEPLGAYASSPGVIRRFCRICGTPMSYENEEFPDEVHLYAASLDDSAGFAAERHDFWNERVAWLMVTDYLPKDA